MEWYRGKKVFITGGSSGIGKATAEHLVRWDAGASWHGENSSLSRASCPDSPPLNRYAPFLLRGIGDRELRNYQKKAFGWEETVQELKRGFTV